MNLEIKDHVRQLLQGIRLFWIEDCKPSIDHFINVMDDSKDLGQSIDQVQNLDVDDNLVIMGIFFILVVTVVCAFFFLAIQNLIVANRCRCVQLSEQIHRIQASSHMQQFIHNQNAAVAPAPVLRAVCSAA